MGFIANAVQGLGGQLSKPNTFQAGMMNQQGQGELQAQDIAQQKQLNEMLMQQSQGQGPNPAQAQYQNNVNRLAQEQAGLISSQKGISPALQAQLIARQGGMAGQQAAGNAATLTAQQQLAAEGQLSSNTLGGIGGINSASLGVQGINAQTAAANSAAQNQMTQQLMGGLGSLGGMALKPGAATPATPAGQSMDGVSGLGPTAPGSWSGLGSMAHGGKAKKSFGSALSMKKGGHVPGKAPFSGDTEGNDTVHAMLSPGEIVIPRTIANNPEQAKEFIKHINNKGTDKASYEKVLAAKKKRKDLDNA